MNAIPPDLKAAIDRYLAESVAGSLVEKTNRMSERYRQGGGSDGALDFGAYLVARLPATYAAVTFCLAELAGRRPQFSPQIAAGRRLGSRHGRLGGNRRLSRIFRLSHFWTTIRRS